MSSDKSVQFLFNCNHPAVSLLFLFLDSSSLSRCKEKAPELDMKRILEFNMAVRSIPTSTSSHLLELPSKDGRIKSPTRGSWPGPVQSNNLMADTGNLLSAEHSKSEMQLSHDQNFMCSGRLSVASCVNSSRKNSGDSNYYSSGEINPPRQMLPPSKSEETLFAIKKKGPSNLHHRKRTTTANTAIPQNHKIAQNETEKLSATPKLLVSTSSSMFSNRSYKKNSKKHLLEPTNESKLT